MDTTSSLNILFGIGDGTFQAPFIFSGGGLSLVVADLNHDGIDDTIEAAGAGSLYLSTPMATVSPSILDFGSVATGVPSRSLAITVTNSGNSPLNVAGTTTSAPFSIAGQVCPSPLGRLASCEIPVEFNSSVPGTQTDQVAIQEDAPNSKPIVLVTGTAVSPSISLNPGSLNFSNQAIAISSAAQTVTLTNTSSVAVTIASVTASGPFVANSQCGTVVAAGAACSITVTFAPTTVGQQTGTLTITDNAAASPQNIALTGSGMAALSLAAQPGGSISATVNSGSTATYALALDAGSGFSGTSSLSCSGVPANATCTITPSSLTLSSGGSGNFSVTVTTGQQVAMNQRSGSHLQFAGAGLLLGAFMLPICVKWRRLPISLMILSVLMVTIPIVGCGGGSSMKTSSRPPTQPTQPTQNVASGTYNLVVTAASGTANATQNLTLTVK